MSGDVQGEDARDVGEDAVLRERIARSLWTFAFAHQPIPEPFPESGEEREDALASADAVLGDLGVYLLGCLDPLGGFHMATSDHEHEEGDPSCRLVVALNAVEFASSSLSDPGAHRENER